MGVSMRITNTTKWELWKQENTQRKLRRATPGFNRRNEGHKSGKNEDQENFCPSFYMWYTLPVSHTRFQIRLAQAFTLLEIIIVVVIIGVLAAMAFPSYQIQMLKVKNQEAVRILTVLWEAQKDYYRDNGVYTANMADLAIDIPSPKNFQAAVLNNNPSIMVTCGSSQNYLASIQDNASTYTLYALTDGRIVCTPCPGSVCQKMGFPASF
jgi:prepilin-type N-terminal cleavage/methylation domain-containing protein